MDKKKKKLSEESRYFDILVDILKWIIVKL